MPLPARGSGHAAMFGTNGFVKVRSPIFRSRSLRGAGRPRHGFLREVSERNWGRPAASEGLRKSLGAEQSTSQRAAEPAEPERALRIRSDPVLPRIAEARLLRQTKPQNVWVPCAASALPGPGPRPRVCKEGFHRCGGWCLGLLHWECLQSVG